MTSGWWVYTVTLQHLNNGREVILKEVEGIQGVVYYFHLKTNIKPYYFKINNNSCICCYYYVHVIVRRQSA